tara:strand:+ start:1350 stop:1982 length:633 start_codon:yes stop_codon:yes gene_type:complete
MKFTTRIIQVNIGLIFFGVGLAAMLQAQLGLGPWEVLHQGIADQFFYSIAIFNLEVDLSSVGVVAIFVSAIVMVLWIPLKEKPGIGTVLNAIIIGITIDLGVYFFPEPNSIFWRSLMMISGPVLVALGSVIYISTELGPGPRDGLMTGIARRGFPIGIVRTGIEGTVLIAGIFLGGNIGVGTIWFAFGVGPMIQFIARYSNSPTLNTIQK